jgi:hypothetical protein
MFGELSMEFRTDDADRVAQVDGDTLGFRIGGGEAAGDQRGE